MKARQFFREDVANIYIPPGRRPVDAGAVTRLVASMGRIGLLTPIVVRDVDGEVTMADGEVVESAYHLVAGRHRLEAAKELGWGEIECELVDASDRRARMVEIAENLHRADLTELERAEQTAEWLRLAQEDEAEQENEKLGQLAQVSAAKGGRGNQGGISAASRDLGIERTQARRAVKIDKLTPEAKAEARSLNLDNNQGALLRAAGQSKEDQIRALREEAAKRADRISDVTASERRVESAVAAVKRLSQEELLVFGDWFDTYREGGGATVFDNTAAGMRAQ